ncbi:MAG TPA: 1,4-dihydroxy-2-naphthoate polyprenyltransferase [Ignavibacteriaceae bacterium]|nr:1,4-dihydroxy-2-naphthoate polyprenyltransferase [Ignavibacteriaceae bacterium]
MNKELSNIKIWSIASRPKTLLAAFVPVMVGSSLAYVQNSFKPVSAIIALVCAILIQIATNFTNDLYDFLKGADTKKRVGPTRVLNAGLVSPSQMKLAIFLTFGLAFILGLYLVFQTGYIILLVGIVSIIAGLAYTAGPYPLAYNGLGDVFVFLFFGFVGTVGTYYVQVLSVNGMALLSSIPVGALITNILVVNNYRDIDQDKIAEKNTLAVILGKAFSKFEYIFLLISSFIIPVLFYMYYEISIWIFLPFLTLPLAYKLVYMLFKYTGEELNKTLELTAKFSAIFGLLFSLGIIL